MIGSRILLVGTLAAMSVASTAVAADSMTRDQYRAERERIDASYKSARERCDAMAGNTKDVCMAEARGAMRISTAELDARNAGTERARENARNVRAEAEYAIAKERCDDVAGNVKDVCLKEAKAAETRAKADAQAERKAASAQRDASQRTAAARTDAAEQKRDAEYEVAREKCDALAGDAKSRCLADARTRYGH